MAAIKKFFEKTKLELKFKKAGEGRKLTTPASTSSKVVPDKRGVAPTNSQELTDERKRAAEAAMARFSKKKETHGRSANVASLKSSILAEKQEMEAAIAQASIYSSRTKTSNLDSSPVVSGVYFRCSSIGSDDVLTEAEMVTHIEHFLYSQLPEEPQLTSILMIHSLNNKDKVKSCIDILSKYLINIIENPGKANYRRIKTSNKVLSEKVLSCKGSLEFLQSLGFEKKNLKLDENEEEFFVLADGEIDNEEETSKLMEILEALQTCEPISMELDRDIKVFSPSQKDVAKFQVPKEFYGLTLDELKREQRNREETVKDLEQLKTREMREKEKRMETRKYRYSALRVKFPDGFMVQATFDVNEKFSSVRQFISECIELSWIPFHLSTNVGQKISEDDKTILELNLAPASLLQFSFDQNVLKDVIRQDNEIPTNKFLRDDLLLLALEI